MNRQKQVMGRGKVVSVEIIAPWIDYTYGRTHDFFWPPWNSTRWLGRMAVDMRCHVCGERRRAWLKIQRFGRIGDRGYHPVRKAWIDAHWHGGRFGIAEGWRQGLDRGEV